MMSIAFDTLGASKRLREVGMDERMAEAVVELVQRTAMPTDLRQLATKTEIGELATKSEMALMESRLRADLSEKIRLQGWAIMGGVAVLVSISTALIKLVP